VSETSEKDIVRSVVVKEEEAFFCVSQENWSKLEERPLTLPILKPLIYVKKNTDYRRSSCSK